jgi:uncharacterized protein YdaU (DUF1376 family)
MNFYKHHLGDYDGATMHLSWDEDMAYTRLLRVYYRDERPIPLELRQVYRLTRAQSKPQREAIDEVLKEFFEKQVDGWHNKRADEEIRQAKAQQETNRRIAANRQRSVNGSSSIDSPESDESKSIGSPPRLQTPDSTSQTPDTHPPQPSLEGRGRVRANGKSREKPAWTPPTEEELLGVEPTGETHATG